MSLSRQKYRAKFRREQRCMTWDAIVKFIARRRRLPDAGATGHRALIYAVEQFAEHASKHALNIARSNRISLPDFTFNFFSLSNYECLANFRFCKDDIVKVPRAMGWPSNVTRTSRNAYGLNPLLATCTVLRRFAEPCGWIDVEEVFGKH